MRNSVGTTAMNSMKNSEMANRRAHQFHAMATGDTGEAAVIVNNDDHSIEDGTFFTSLIPIDDKLLPNVPRK